MNLRKLKDSRLGISRLERVKDSDVASKLESIDDIFQINGITMSDRRFDELRDYGKTTVSCGEGWNAEEIVKDLKEFGFKASAHGKRVTVWVDSTKVNDSEDNTSVEVLIPCELKEFCENFGYFEDDVIRKVNGESLEDATQFFLEEVDENLYQNLEPEDYDNQGDFYSSQVETAIETTYNWLHGSKVELCEWSGDWDDNDIIDLVKGLNKV